MQLGLHILCLKYILNMCNCPTGGVNLGTGKKTCQNIEIHVSMTETFFWIVEG